MTRGRCSRLEHKITVTNLVARSSQLTAEEIPIFFVVMIRNCLLKVVIVAVVGVLVFEYSAKWRESGSIPTSRFNELLARRAKPLLLVVHDIINEFGYKLQNRSDFFRSLLSVLRRQSKSLVVYPDSQIVNQVARVYHQTAILSFADKVIDVTRDFCNLANGDYSPEECPTLDNRENFISGLSTEVSFRKFFCTEAFTLQKA